MPADDTALTVWRNLHAFSHGMHWFLNILLLAVLLAAYVRLRLGFIGIAATGQFLGMLFEILCLARDELLLRSDAGIGIRLEVLSLVSVSLLLMSTLLCLRWMWRQKKMVPNKPTGGDVQ
jgi:hypothetical protein